MSEKKVKIRLSMTAASGDLVSVPMEDLHNWAKAQDDLRKAHAEGNEEATLQKTYEKKENSKQKKFTE